MFTRIKLTNKGNYITISGNLKKIDIINKWIILTSNIKIELDNIIKIK